MSFHPDAISRLQERFLDTFEIQVVASLLLVLSIYAVYRATSALRPRYRDRYDRYVSESLQMLLLALWIVLVVFALAIVWDITFVIRFVVELVLVDRITVILYVVTFAVLLTAYLLARVVNRSFDRLAEAGTLTGHQSGVAHHVVNATVFAVSGFVILSLWGVNVTNLLVGAGVLSAVIGLGARKTVAAFIAGFLLLFARPFYVNDWIKVVTAVGDQQSGIVQDVTILHTKIRTFNEEHVMIPNNEVTSGQLVNYSRNESLRLDVEVAVDYDTDIETARTVISSAVDDLDHVRANPEPRTVAKEFGDSGILLELQLWIDEPDRQTVWDVQTAAIQRVKNALDEEGMVIPFPQRVHSTREGGFRIDAPGDDGSGPHSEE